MENLEIVVAILIALSVASERLVEIVKGVIPFLNQEHSDAKKEGWRKAILQTMAVVAGIGTALLAKPGLAGTLPDTWTSTPAILAMGFLASGGSGFWNSIQSYLLNVKNIKKLEASGG